MPRKKTDGTAKYVTSVKHKDKRANIPTEELRDFVADDEKQPKTLLYPRDPSLDPQLVWKGKDEQDRSDLAVPAVPIYIQEKIHPQAIIENVREAPLISPRTRGESLSSPRKRGESGGPLTTKAQRTQRIKTYNCFEKIDKLKFSFCHYNHESD